MAVADEVPPCFGIFLFYGDVSYEPVLVVLPATTREAVADAVVGEATHDVPNWEGGEEEGPSGCMPPN